MEMGSELLRVGHTYEGRDGGTRELRQVDGSQIVMYLDLNSGITKLSSRQ